MNKHLAVICLIVVASIVVSCGGDDELANVLRPHEIPAEYVGLSIDELEEKSGGLSYRDVVGTKKDGSMYVGGIVPEISGNIELHTGKLFTVSGIIDSVFPSKEVGTFTFWLCLSKTKGDERSGVKTRLKAAQTMKTGTDCIDPVFLLYNLDRGPEFTKGDLAKVSGIITGSREKKGKVVDGPTTLVTAYVTPSVSVIKADHIELP